MKGIKIISFDGLNRSGKGTQLKMLRSSLEKELTPVRIVRGDGSREGKDSIDYYDPESAWWVRWQSNKNKTPEDWDRAYTILSKEVEDEFSHFSYNQDNGFFLMDRCYISRWFVERQRNKDISFDEIINTNQVFPNKYFILDAPKEVLLSRQSDDNPKKAQFRKQIVEQWYDLWQDTVLRFEDRLGKSVIRLDATKGKYDIHQDILSNIKVYK